MQEAIEKIILERIEKPGWLTTRAVQRDPRQESFENEVAQIEGVMKSLADKGLVTLWRLILEQDGEELLAAAKPGLELDKDLEQRGAWAKAIRYEETG